MIGFTVGCLSLIVVLSTRMIYQVLLRIATALEATAGATAEAKAATLTAVQEARQAIATMKQQRAASDAAVTASLKRMETVTQDLLRRVPAKKGFRTQ